MSQWSHPVNSRWRVDVIACNWGGLSSDKIRNRLTSFGILEASSDLLPHRLVFLGLLGACVAPNEIRHCLGCMRQVEHSQLIQVSDRL